MKPSRRAGATQTRHAGENAVISMLDIGIEIRCSIQLSYERVRRVDYQTWPAGPAARTSVAGMPPAVLADIGGGALAAEDGGGAVVIGEGAGLQAGAVIVQVADRVGQRPNVVRGGADYGGRRPGSGPGPRRRGGRRQRKTSLWSFRFSGSPTGTVAISSWRIASWDKAV